MSDPDLNTVNALVFTPAEQAAELPDPARFNLNT